MSFVGRHIRRCSVPLARVVFASIALTAVGNTYANSVNAATTHPACVASQIRVTEGPTQINAPYTLTTSTGKHQARAFELVPVTFYNVSATCHLLMGAPVFLAVRNTTTVSATTPIHDLSMSAGADNTKRVVVMRHRKVEALFLVAKPIGPSFIGCESATTSGLSVGGYANPVGTSHFIVRRLRDVCFDFKAGSHVLNIGTIWKEKP